MFFVAVAGPAGFDIARFLMRVAASVIVVRSVVVRMAVGRIGGGFVPIAPSADGSEVGVLRVRMMYAAAQQSMQGQASGDEMRNQATHAEAHWKRKNPLALSRSSEAASSSAAKRSIRPRRPTEL